MLSPQRHCESLRRPADQSRAEGLVIRARVLDARTDRMIRARQLTPKHSRPYTAGSGRGTTPTEERQEKAKEVQEEVEKGTTRVHAMSSPVRLRSPCVGDLPLVIGSSGRSLEPGESGRCRTFVRMVQIARFAGAGDEGVDRGDNAVRAEGREQGGEAPHVRRRTGPMGGQRRRARAGNRPRPVLPVRARHRYRLSEPHHSHARDRADEHPEEVRGPRRRDRPDCDRREPDLGGAVGLGRSRRNGR